MELQDQLLTIERKSGPPRDADQPDRGFACLAGARCRPPLRAEALVQVEPDVLHVFDSDAEPQQRRRQGFLTGKRGATLDGRFDAAKTGRVLHQPDTRADRVRELRTTPNVANHSARRVPRDCDQPWGRRHGGQACVHRQPAVENGRRTPRPGDRDAISTGRMHVRHSAAFCSPRHSSASLGARS
jgi:hypothetical protein